PWARPVSPAAPLTAISRAAVVLTRVTQPRWPNASATAWFIQLRRVAARTRQYNIEPIWTATGELPGFAYCAHRAYPLLTEPSKQAFGLATLSPTRPRASILRMSTGTI